RASLLMEVAPGRYAFHDLLRAYAAEQPTSPEGVANTTRRMLDHYLHTAHRAHRVLYPGRELIGLEALAPGSVPETFGRKQAAFTVLEDDLGLARTDVIFSQALECQGRHAEALAVIGEALRLSESAPADLNMRLVRASALNGSAWNSVQLGDLSEARACCVQ